MGQAFSSQQDPEQTSNDNDIDFSTAVISRPFETTKQISMKVDEKTGELVNMPDVWANGDIRNLKATSQMNTTTLPICVRPDAPSQELIEKLNDRPSVISRPIASKHNFHVEIDPSSEWGLKGLPPEWVVFLQESGLRKSEIKKQPKEILNVLLVTTGARRALPERKIVEQQMREVLNINDTDPNDVYHFDSRVGKGGQGLVFLARKKNPANESEDHPYAMKLMKVTDKLVEYKIKKEIAIGMLAKSSYVINFFEIYRFKGYIFLVMEYMDAGNLTKFIMTYFRKIPENVIAYILWSILMGIQDLHNLHRIHRDIKSDNVLLAKDGRIKLADFGFAIQLTQETTHRKSVVGTPCWMAPELIQETAYDEKVDIWSIGILAIELGDGEPPYIREQPIKIMYKISCSESPKLTTKGWSKDFEEFLAKCLERTPKNRPTCKELLAMPFMKNANSKANLEAYLGMLKNIREVKKDYLAVKDIPSKDSKPQK